MRPRTQKRVLFFASMFTALMALVLVTNVRPRIVLAQDTSRVDVKLAEKRAPTPQVPAVGAPTAAPANDNCANAITIATCPFTNTQNTAMSTTEAGEPTPCGAIAATIWYTLTASANRRNVTVDTCTSSPLDTVLAAYKVTGAACAFAGFVNVACNDDFCGDDGFQSRIAFTADAGATYKIQAGGFRGGTGNLTINVACADILCDDVVIRGTLGSNDPTFPGPRTSGNQTGRLNRNGVSSSCAAPKSCLIFTAVGSRAFDAYTIPNQSGQNVCVSVNLTETAGQTCNLQSNAYLNSYTPASICTNYLADPGLSTGVPPTPTNMSFIVPTGQSLIVVVHTTNPGETGCTYTLTVTGNLCSQFDFCVQDNNTPRRFILINSTNGDYEYHDCSKGITLKGRGVVAIDFCKIELFDSGPNPKKPDRFIDVLVNPCTMKGDASVRLPGTTNVITLDDSNITNNNCKCP